MLTILALALFSNVTADRSTSTPASGITKVVIIARAGSLDVNGKSGATAIAATGKAEAPNDAQLAQTKLVATRNGSQLTIEAQTGDDASLGFEVTLPAGVAVVIKDGSGSMTVKNVGDLDVTDGSGSIEIHDVTGNVRITDGSGSIEVKQVKGNVTITDDGSGSVDVQDVQGDFTVLQKGSGHIDYERISGKVSVPKR